MCSPDFFPASLNCSEVAAILHRNLHEPRNGPFFFSFKRQRRSKYNGNKSSASNEDMIRQKYQAETEQLRAPMEKGMLDMERSHVIKRIIAQMEVKHQQDLNRLKVCFFVF